MAFRYTEKKLKEIYSKTKDFPENFPLKIRNLCIKNSLTVETFPKCPVCSKFVTWSSTEKELLMFCSNSCKNSKKGKDATHTKKKNTFLGKYGEDNPFKVEKIKNKIKQTNLEKYGADYPMRNAKVKEKLTATLLDKYGVTNASQMPATQKK